MWRPWGRVKTMVSECVLSIIPLIQSNASPFKSCQACHSLASTRHWTLEFLWRLQADFDHDLAPFDRIYDGLILRPWGAPWVPHKSAPTRYGPDHGSTRRAADAVRRLVRCLRALAGALGRPAVAAGRSFEGAENVEIWSG